MFETVVIFSCFSQSIHCLVGGRRDGRGRGGREGQEEELFSSTLSCILLIRCFDSNVTATDPTCFQSPTVLVETIITIVVTGSIEIVFRFLWEDGGGGGVRREAWRPECLGDLFTWRYLAVL